MKAKLLALFLMAAALVSTGCMASVRYNRYQYGPAYRYDRDKGRHERYRHHRHRDHGYDDRRDYLHGNRDDGRR